MTHAPLLAAAAMAAAAAAAAPAFAAPGVQVENAAARLVVIPEARRDVSVSVRQGDGRLPPVRTRAEGERVVVDGGLGDRIQSCGVINFNFGAAFRHRHGDPAPGQKVMIRGLGLVPIERLPVITARVPMDTQVSASEAVWGEVGPSDRLRLSKSGCGAFRVADVKGDFDLASAGSGDTAVGRTGRMRAALRGSGDLAAGEVSGDADIAVTGSGDAKLSRVGGGLSTAINGSGGVRAEEAQGPVNASIAGSGDVVIEHGRAPAVAARIRGSGDFRFGGEAGSLSAQIAGSGDIHVARVSGPVAKSVRGSGEVYIGR